MDMSLGETTNFAEYFNSVEQAALQNDYRLQNTVGKQEPFSDAYLSGLPTGKRGKILQSRPSPIFNKFLKGAVTHFSKIRSNGPTDKFCLAFHNYCQAVIRVRILRSSDYNPIKFSGVNEYISSEVEDINGEVVLTPPPGQLASVPTTSSE